MEKKYGRKFKIVTTESVAAIAGAGALTVGLRVSALVQEARLIEVMQQFNWEQVSQRFMQAEATRVHMSFKLARAVPFILK